jgi:hypothetical protein
MKTNKCSHYRKLQTRQKSRANSNGIQPVSRKTNKIFGLENSKNLSDDNKTVKTGLPIKNFYKRNNLQIFEKL